MASNSIRSATKVKLRTLIAAENLLRADGKAVQVSHGFPGALLENECIWIGAVEGPVTVPSLKAGRKRRHDNFTIDIHVVAAIPGKQSSPALAEARFEDLMEAVEDVIADDPHLDGLDGLAGGAMVVEIEGPDADGDIEGWVATAVIRVECKSSLT